MNEGKENKGALKYTLFIGIPVIIVLGVLGAYYHMTNPMSVLTKTINEAYNKVDSLLIESKEILDINETPLTLNGNLKFKTDIDLEELNELQNYNYDFNINLDLKQKFASAEMKLNDDTRQIISAIFYQIENKQYFESTEITDGLLKISNEVQEFDKLFNFTIDENLKNLEISDVQYLLETIKESFIKTLSDEFLSREKTDITINGRQLKTTKITYNMNQENQKRTVEKMKNSLKNDEKFIQIIAKSSGISEQEMKENLEKAEESFSNEFNFCIYTEGWNQNVVRISLNENNFDVLTYLNYKDETSLNINNDLILNFKEYNNIIEINYNIPSAKITGTLKLETKQTNKNRTERTILFKINSSDFNFEINLKLDIELHAEIKIPDTSNSKPIDSLTTEEIGNMFEKLEKALDGTFFIDLIESNIM